MRRLTWTDAARAEFDTAVRYIAEDSPIAGRRVGERILIAANALADMPTGRRGRVGGTYEKVVTGLPYNLVYDLDDPPGALRILHLIHGARDWPDDAWPD